MGGGGVQAQLTEKTLTTFFFLYSPQIILQFYRGVQWFILRKTIIF